MQSLMRRSSWMDHDDVDFISFNDVAAGSMHVLLKAEVMRSQIFWKVTIWDADLDQANIHARRIKNICEDNKQVNWYFQRRHRI